MAENNKPPNQSYEDAVDELVKKLRLPAEYAVILKESADLRLHREIAQFNTNVGHSFEGVSPYIKEFLENNVSFVKRVSQADIDRRMDGFLSEEGLSVKQSSLFPSYLQTKTPLARSRFYKFITHFRNRGKNPDA